MLTKWRQTRARNKRRDTLIFYNRLYLLFADQKDWVSAAIALQEIAAAMLDIWAHDELVAPHSDEDITKLVLLTEMSNDRIVDQIRMP